MGLLELNRYPLQKYSIHMPPSPPPAPQRFYYLHNFQRALDWLHTRYGDLLGVDDLQFLTDFRQLPQAAQALHLVL